MIDYDYLFKLIIIGDSCVGKTCLLSQFIYDNLQNCSGMTVGVEFANKDLILKDDTKIKLNIWDTAGQETFKSITRSYFRNSSGVILVYDITNRKSFISLQNWLEDIKEYGDIKTPIILVGNKNDLNSKRIITQLEGKKFAEENNLLFIEASSYKYDDVEKIFTTLTENIYNKIKNDPLYEFEKYGIKKNNIQITKEEVLKKSSCCSI